MNIVLFETQIWKDLLPISYTRFMHDIVVGIFSNSERVQYFKEFSVSYAVPRISQFPYSYNKFSVESKLWDSSCSEDTVIWNSSFVFDAQLVRRLSPNTGIRSGDNVWIAVRMSSVSQEELDAIYIEHLIPRIKWIEEDVYSFRSYEDLVKGVQVVLQDDIELYLATHSEFVEVQNNVFVHPSAQIRTPIDFDTSQGKIVIGAGTKVTAFTLIEGPVFIGSECLITRAFLRPKTVVLDYCRIAGELSLSTVNAYSNKSHDGCIALSYIGSWVNLGASTECATLKYTYTPVSFEVNGKKITTSMIGCGTVFGDWCSTGVGTVFPPAAVVAVGAVLHEPYSKINKYTKPFAWGNNNVWNIHKWIEAASVKMSRRNMVMSENEKLFYHNLFDFLVSSDNSDI
ncbi:MAG: putative sugar nucleotidyl transferase [Brevinemataceae bacterium]